MKKVTVLMSVFNDIDYLDAAINSILHQTFSEFEFLIIDDASKDNIVALKFSAKKMIEKHKASLEAFFID